MPRIVVVDDDPSIREMLSSIFQAQGHYVTTAADGQEGLETIRSVRPNLIFLDLMMPRLDGYEVLDLLKEDESLQKIPVIILTTLDHRNQIVEGLQKGANDYIAKPFNMQELLARANVQFRILELEQQIRRSEAYHRALFEHASDPELVLDKSGAILQANAAATELLDVQGNSLLQKLLLDLVLPEDRPEVEMAVRGAYEGSEIPIFEIHLALPDGKILPVDTDLSLVEMEGHRRLLLHLRDIHRRKAAETRSNMIFEYIGDGILITNQTGVILMASRSVATLTGRAQDEIIGLDIARFHSEEGLARWQKAIQLSKGDGPHVYEDLVLQQNGNELPVEWTVAGFTVGSEAYFINVARDLLDRRAADERRMEADRLKTLLEIAGGAAHEINQPLTAILGYSEMAMDVLGEDHAASSYQKHIIQASMRISEILKRMQAIREYRTRPYADGHQIVDFEKSSHTEKEKTGEERPEH